MLDEVVEVKPTEEVKPTKDINLILGHGKVVSVEDEQKKSKKKKLVLAGGGLFLLLVTAAFLVGWQSAAPPPSKVSQIPDLRSSDPGSREAGPSVYDPTDPVFWSTYTDAVNLFSLKYPRGTTVGKRPDNPFPVAVALKFDDDVVETVPGAEKPGWLLTVSATQANPKNLTLLEWAKDKGLEIPGSARQSLLDGRQTLSWSSAVYPETFYLGQRDEGMVFMKLTINSAKAEEHRQTVDKILATLKYFKKENDPDVGLKWVRKQFGSAWDIEYPEAWEINEEGKSQGSIVLSGRLEGGLFQVNFFYPVFDSGIPLTLVDWVEAELSRLSSDQRSQVVLEDFRMGGTEAKKVFNYGLEHRLYLWKRAGRNPGLMVVSQLEGEFDSALLARILDRFAAGIR